MTTRTFSSFGASTGSSDNSGAWAAALAACSTGDTLRVDGAPGAVYAVTSTVLGKAGVRVAFDAGVVLRRTGTGLLLNVDGCTDMEITGAGVLEVTGVASDGVISAVDTGIEGLVMSDGLTIKAGGGYTTILELVDGALLTELVLSGGIAHLQGADVRLIAATAQTHHTTKYDRAIYMPNTTDSEVADCVVNAPYCGQGIVVGASTDIVSARIAVRRNRIDNVGELRGADGWSASLLGVKCGIAMASGDAHECRANRVLGVWATHAGGVAQGIRSNWVGSFPNPSDGVTNIQVIDNDISGLSGVTAAQGLMLVGCDDGVIRGNEIWPAVSYNGFDATVFVKGARNLIEWNEAGSGFEVFFIGGDSNHLRHNIAHNPNGGGFFIGRDETPLVATNTLVEENMVRFTTAHDHARGSYYLAPSSTGTFRHNIGDARVFDMLSGILVDLDGVGVAGANFDWGGKYGTLVSGVQDAGGNNVVTDPPTWAAWYAQWQAAYAAAYPSTWTVVTPTRTGPADADGAEHRRQGTSATARRLFPRYGGMPVGRSILKIGGVYQTVDGPTTDQIASATEVYLGGHKSQVSDTVAAALTVAGYTVG